MLALLATATAKRHHHSHHLHKAAGDVEEAQCKCATPGQGTAHYNKYECTDGRAAWCAHDEECFVNNGTRPFSLRAELCRKPPCTCKTPLSGTAHHNLIVCKYDGPDDWRACRHDHECYRNDTAPKDVAQVELCRVPRCECATPFAEGTKGSNAITCTDGTTDRCQDHEECWGGSGVDQTKPKGEHLEMCRVPRCSCKTPGQGTEGHNEIWCSDGTEFACDQDEECFEAEPEAAAKNERQKLCRVPVCSCQTPLAGTVGHNRISCTDDVSNPYPIWCHHEAECFQPTNVTKPRDVAQMELCRTPLCHCETPNQGTVHYNRIRCTDHSNVWCAANEQCVKPVEHEVPFNQRAQLCASRRRRSRAARRRTNDELLRRITRRLSKL